MSDMNAIVIEFVEEGNEKADQMERHLIQLEKNPGSRELLAEVFRSLHSIILLSLVDAVRELLSEIAATGQEGNRDYTALIGALVRLQKTP